MDTSPPPSERPPEATPPGVVARRPSTLPNRGEIFLDARGDERALRVSWHAEAGLVVLSLWRGNACSGSFRLAVAQVPDLMEVLRAGLRSSYQVHRPVLERTGDRAC